MGRRGRPRSPRAASARRVYVKLHLYPGEDDDLIAFFDDIPEGLRAAMVKRALRSGVRGGPSQSSPEDDDLLEALDAFIA